MEVVYRCCCGIDVHKKVLVACILNGRDAGFRETGTTTEEINSLADWLVENGVEKVAMESTASYWKPLYNILEDRGIPGMVVNAQHMKNVPGRKTDIGDAEWIASLLQHGLLESSYIPSRRQRELRETLVYRKSLVTERASELNRTQKMLEGANIKLSGTVSSIEGKSGRHLLQAVISGKPVTADDIRHMQDEKLVSRRLRATPEELAASLDGVFSDGQRSNLKDAISHHDDLSRRIESIEERVRSSLTAEQKEAVRLLVTMPGVSEVSAMNIIAVIGTDMGQFGTAERLCSWAGIAPGNNESAKKKRTAHCTKGNALLRYTIIQCASSASKAKGSFFQAQHDRLAVRRGRNRAKMAVAHSMLISIFHMLDRHEEFRDLGSDYYDKRDLEAKKRSIKKKINSLGLSREELLEMLKD